MADDRIEIEIVLDDGSIQKGFSKIQKSGKETSEQLESSFSSFGRSALKTIGGIAAGFASLQGLRTVLNNIRDLDIAFAEITTIIPDVTKANEELRQSLIDTSSQFGTTAADQAKAFYQIVSAGITDVAQANQLLITANKLAIGGLTDIGTSIDVLTSVVNAYGAEVLSAEKASDILFGTVRLGKTRVDELAASVGQIAPTASSLGLAFEDVGGALAALTTRGISTSEAVTQLNAILTAVLKNQERAKKLGPEVAEAFSLQALQTKGLSGFLQDLNVALGGSESQLVKLLGRVEGARAIITLAGDDFSTLSSNIDQLRNSAGATDQAFQKINDTLNQQLAVLGSSITNLFVQLGQSTDKTLIGIIKSLNAFVANLTDNLDIVIERFVLATRVIFQFIAAVKLTPIVLRAATASFSGLRNGVAAVIPALKNLAINLQVLRINFKTIGFKGFINGLKGVNIGAKITAVGLAGLRVAANLLKASLTLGLTFALDFIIQKFIEVKESFAGIGNLFSFVSISVQKSLNNILISVIELLRKLEKIPFIGKSISAAITPALDDVELKAIGTLQKLDVQLGQLVDNVAKAREETSKPLTIPSLPTIKNEDGKPPFSEVSEGIKKAQEDVKMAKEGFSIGLAETSKLIFDFSESARNGLGRGIAAGIQGAVTALQKGEDAFSAFAKGFLAVLGDLSIQLGTQLIVAGLGLQALFSLNPAGAIAFGAALIAIGTLLKGFAGGGQDAGGGVPPAQDAVTSPITDSPISDDLEEESARVAVTIQGDVFDSDETGLRIANILKDEGFNNAVVS